MHVRSRIRSTGAHAAYNIINVVPYIHIGMCVCMCIKVYGSCTCGGHALHVQGARPETFSRIRVGASTFSASNTFSRDTPCTALCVSRRRVRVVLIVPPPGRRRCDIYRDGPVVTHRRVRVEVRPQQLTRTVASYKYSILYRNNTAVNLFYTYCIRPNERARAGVCNSKTREAFAVTSCAATAIGR